MIRKQFKIQGSAIAPLAPGHGSCIASDRITVDGRPVGLMVRTSPGDDTDSGWQFLAGDESPAYCDDASNFGVYDVNTVCNYDPSIIPLLGSPPETALERDSTTGRFVRQR